MANNITCIGSTVELQPVKKLNNKCICTSKNFVLYRLENTGQKILLRRPYVSDINFVYLPGKLEKRELSIKQSFGAERLGLHIFEIYNT